MAIVLYYLFWCYRNWGCLPWLKVRADLRKLSERQFLIAERLHKKLGD
jgi:hypothetical protein